MKLGFIGTGRITSAVVTGICSSNISYENIIISHRNRSISNNLKNRFKKITISKNNQEIINSCDWIFLSVTPTVGNKIIKDLKFKSSQTIISFISTITFLAVSGYVLGERKIIILFFVAASASFIIWYLVEQVLGIYLRPLPTIF